MLPEDYVTFVTTYAEQLRHAADRAVGHDGVTEPALREALGALALAWRRLPAARRLPYALRRLSIELADYTRAPVRLEAVGEAVRYDRRKSDRVPEPAELAELAWAESRIIRRRRFLVLGGGAVIVGAFTALGGRGLGPTVAPNPEATPTALPRLVRIMPNISVLATSPLRPTALPTRIALPATSSTPRLGDSPVPRVAALLERRSEVFALTADGEFRLVEGLEVTSLPWVGTGALNADGTRAVLQQPYLLIVVDFPTGRQRRYPIPGGYPNHLAWLPDGRLLIGLDARSIVLDPASGLLRPVPFNAEDIVIGAGPELLEFKGASGSVPATIRSWPASSTSVLAELAPASRMSGPLPTGKPDRDVPLALGPGLAWIGYWTEAGWRRGRQVARTCNASDLRVPAGFNVPLYGAVAMDTDGVVLGVLVQLAVAGGIPNSSIVLGWLDDDTVLLLTGEGTYHPIVAWAPRTGALSLVSSLSESMRVALPQRDS